MTQTIGCPNRKINHHPSMSLDRIHRTFGCVDRCALQNIRDHQFCVFGFGVARPINRNLVGVVALVDMHIHVRMCNLILEIKNKEKKKNR